MGKTETTEALRAREAGMSSWPAGTDSQRRVRATAGGHPPLLSRFNLQHELGRGGAGAVYRAYDRSAGHEVALKILHGFSVDDRQRLKNEFRALSDIIHPNLVDLYELVMEEDACFFTMELVKGSDFATYVTSLKETTSDRDEQHERMLDLARQLALGLNALHQGGKLHRDVKPGNVLVTDAGRVVLVDFGLAISTVREAAAAQEPGAGTPLYMSPEQLLGASLTPASDWFSFGVTLYESVCGEAPRRLDLFRSTADTKSNGLRSRGFDVPAGFDELIAGLLLLDPNARPRAAEIMECLGSRSLVEVPSLSLLPLRDAPELIGRQSDLSRLRQMLDATDGTRVVRVLGPSGIGKTSMLRSFFDSLESSPQHLLLKSRCHPQEAVVFNAIDGLIDGLASGVTECLDAQERKLPGAEHMALTQVFPVLATVLEAEESESHAYTDDRQKRYLAFVGLCEVLKRVARRYRIVAWLDDVQWGDHDSGTLLRDLLGHGDRPPMMLVMSYRSEDESTSPCLQILREESDLWSKAETISLGPLGDDQSSELVDKLLTDGWNGDRQRRDELVKAAAGSPYVLGELARYLSSGAEDPSAPRMGLDEILRIRTRDLPVDCRLVLDVLAVAGAPLEQQVTLTAAGIASGSRGVITSLERLSILRTTDIRTHRIEFYHDRMRQEVMSQLSSDARGKHHHSIARALLSASVPNPLAAIDHFEAARDTESVRRYVVAAANHALKNLAFERAARLYQRAIELRPGEVPLHELQRRLGSALGSFGRGREAALAYSAAAESLRGDARPHAEQIVQLQQKAAEQFIQTGHFAEGLRILRAVLSEFDVPFPSSHGQALRKAALLRLASFVHRFRPSRTRRPADEQGLLRFDALWAASSRLSMVDYALSSWATARCARDAVLLGEPSRMSRALSMEAAFSSLLPQPIFQKRASTLLKMAEDLAVKGEDPEHDSIFTLGARAIISFYNGRFRDTWQEADLAIARLHKHSPGRTWEEGPWQMWSLLGLSQNGEVGELVRRMRSLRDDAALRDDRSMDQNTSLGAPAIAWIVTDSVEEAEVRANRAIGWAGTEYTAQHYQHYVTIVDYALYRDDGPAAWQKTVDTWPSHSREGFLMLTFIRDDLLRARGRAALAASMALRKSGRPAVPSGHTANQLHAIAKGAAKQMRERGPSYARGFGLLLEGGIANLEGRRSVAVAALDGALAAFDRADMQLFREVARFGLGWLQAGENGRAQMATAERWMGEQGVVKPRKVVATIAPGLL